MGVGSSVSPQLCPGRDAGYSTVESDSGTSPDRDSGADSNRSSGQILLQLFLESGQLGRPDFREILCVE